MPAGVSFATHMAVATSETLRIIKKLRVLETQVIYTASLNKYYGKMRIMSIVRWLNITDIRVIIYGVHS